MTNAQCLSEEENPKVEDMAVGMIIAKVGLDFNIEVNAESYVPIYHQMKGWLLSEKKNSTLNFGEDRCYLPRGFRKILLMYFNMKVRKKQVDASIEMKVVALEKVIETQKQIIQMKKDLNIDVSLNADKRLHVLSMDDLMAYAEYFDEHVSVEGRYSFSGVWYIYASFYHSGTEIYTFPDEEEVEKYIKEGKIENYEQKR